MYWSTSKVASHIRSGHCQGASEAEVQQFKQEFVYDTPKNLVHKSAVTKKFKETFEIEEYRLVKNPKAQRKKSPRLLNMKRPKFDEDEHEAVDDDDEAIIYEEYSTEEVDAQTGDQKLEIVFLPQSSDTDRLSEVPDAQSTSDMSREDKFIQAVYPQFKGKTKLQLIEDILDLKRQNEQLHVKAKNYENSINRLLN